MNDTEGETNMYAGNTREECQEKTSNARHSEPSEPTDTSHIPEFESSGTSPGLTQTEKRKRGRPRKHANDAAKMAAYRLREQKKREDAMHTRVVAWLIKRCKTMLASPSKKPSNKTSESVDTILAKNRQYLREFEKNLFALPIDELKKVKNICEQAPDSHGRLHNERSGDAGRKMGLSEIERILDARRAFGGRKVGPIGRGPDSYETTDADDPGIRKWGPKVPATSPRLPHVQSESTCVTRSKMVCCIPDCGLLGVAIHPADRFKRLSEVRVLCDHHRNFVTPSSLGYELNASSSCSLSYE
jgi:hypothetical protein